MELIVCGILILTILLIGLFSKRNDQKNKITAAYLLLVVACTLLAVYFNNQYSLILYGLALLSSIFAFVFSVKKSNYSA